jgi:hypothetical protein
MNIDNFNNLPAVVSMNHTSGYIATSLIILSVGVVHAYVDQKVPRYLILRLFLYHFLHTMSL